MVRPESMGDAFARFDLDCEDGLEVVELDTRQGVFLTLCTMLEDGGCPCIVSDLMGIDLALVEGVFDSLESDGRVFYDREEDGHPTYRVRADFASYAGRDVLFCYEMMARDLVESLHRIAGGVYTQTDLFRFYLADEPGNYEAEMAESCRRLFDNLSDSGAAVIDSFDQGRDWLTAEITVLDHEKAERVVLGNVETFFDDSEKGWDVIEAISELNTSDIGTSI